MKIIIKFLVLFLFISSCSSMGVNSFREKRTFLPSGKETKYESKELAVRNYQLCSFFTWGSKRTYDLPANDDSLMGVFLSSLEKLDLYIYPDHLDDRNYCNRRNWYKWNIKKKNLDEDRIIELANGSEDELILFPVIYLGNRLTNIFIISSAGMADHRGFTHNSFFNLIIYIILSDQIIYSKHVMYVTDIIRADDRNEIESVPSGYLIRQEHWDELVRLAMKDYIERLN